MTPPAPAAASGDPLPASAALAESAANTGAFSDAPVQPMRIISIGPAVADAPEPPTNPALAGPPRRHTFDDDWVPARASSEVGPDSQVSTPRLSLPGSSVEPDEVEVRFDDDPGSGAYGSGAYGDGDPTPIAPAVGSWPHAVGDEPLPLTRTLKAGPPPTFGAGPVGANASVSAIFRELPAGSTQPAPPALPTHEAAPPALPTHEAAAPALLPAPLGPPALLPAPLGAAPPVAVPAPAAPARRSDPPDAEIGVEDVLAIEPSPVPIVVGVAPPLPPVQSQPPAAPPISRRAHLAASARSPLVIIPPHVGSIPPQSQEAPGSRRKGRFWWEELFSDDYIRGADRVTDDEVAREVHFIEESLGVERGGALLDLGCGAGRHAIALAKQGYEVVGFDLSLAMLARAGEEAQEREARLTFVQGDMREMAFDEQFDGIYCWNTSFGYFDDDKNAQVVDRVHRALKSGGLFLLDVVNRDFLVREAPSLAWFEGDGCVCMDDTSVDFITSRLKVKRTMMLDDGRTREIDYSIRIYSLHELGRVLHEHGFKVREVSGRLAMPGIFFGNESPRAIILAEKR